MTSHMKAGVQNTTSMLPTVFSTSHRAVVHIKQNIVAKERKGVHVLLLPLVRLSRDTRGRFMKGNHGERISAKTTQ